MTQELKDLLDAAVESRRKILALFHSGFPKGVFLSASEKHTENVDALLDYWETEQSQAVQS